MVVLAKIYTEYYVEAAILNKILSFSPRFVNLNVTTFNCLDCMV